MESSTVTSLSLIKSEQIYNTTEAKQNNDPIIIKPEGLQTGELSLSKQHSTLIRVVKENSTSVISWEKEGIRFSNVIEGLKHDHSFNSAMKTVVLDCVEGASQDNKIAMLEKGLEFLETERELSNLVNNNHISLETAKEILAKCLNWGAQKDFDLEKLNKFNTFLENHKDEKISEKLDELLNSSSITQQSVSVEETKEVIQSNTKNLEKTDSPKAVFAKLSECFEGKNAEPIKQTISTLIESYEGDFDKNLLNTIKKTLKEKFGVDQKTFNKAWAIAISCTQGGEIIKNEPINLKFDDQEVKIQMSFIPQVKLSGFTEDTTDMKHCSSVYQSATIGDTKHAVNLWKQDIALSEKEVTSMSFLRHGYILEQETAAKEILANACVLQHGETAVLKSTKESPLSLTFSNIQLMSLGKIADQDKPWKQMEMFNKLAEQPLELQYGGKPVYVTFKKPLLFNFGVNVQHFKHLELGASNAKKNVKKQNLTSFKQLFGEGFPHIKENKFDGLIGEKLKSNEMTNEQKTQIKTLANQILEIYQSHPEGLKENPYALPTRVIALTNLLDYATSFNCKSGKDRTGVCAMELSNLCAQMMSGNTITDPMHLTFDKKQEEQKNLQAIYKEGSCVRDISKINTVLQAGLKTDSNFLFSHINTRFGIDLTKPFDTNLKKLNSQI